MARANLILHLPQHRKAALQVENDTPEARAAYDSGIGAYVRFLQEQARAAGFTLNTDTRDHPVPFSIDEQDHIAKQDAHAWLQAQPGIWDWIT